MSDHILIVDDEDDICMLIEGLLEDEGYRVSTAARADRAFEIIAKDTPDLVIQDIWLQGSTEDGLDILRDTKAAHPILPFLMISGHGTVETAVSAIKLGAYDFIEKPFKSDRLLMMIERALESAALKRENKTLKSRRAEGFDTDGALLPAEIRGVLEKAAKTNSRILLTGENGTGKLQAAQFVHAQSTRADKPFMMVSCLGHTAESLDRELFGGVNDAGLFSMAHGGTLFIQDLFDMPEPTQGKLLSVLQDGVSKRIGGVMTDHVDVRVIVAADTEAADAPRMPSFREDLFYRLNITHVFCPPLRKRAADIPALIAAYKPIQFSDHAMSVLKSCRWQGNIKQLYNMIDRMIMTRADALTHHWTAEDLPQDIRQPHTQESDTGMYSDEAMMTMGLRDARECFERHYLLSQIQKFDGNISKTAEFIGMERSALHRKLKTLDVLLETKQSMAS